MSAEFDLAAYLRRIGLASAPALNWDGLGALHLAHLQHIPFENLDVQLGRPIRLDVASLQAKLVQGRRGGYCFEQNRLFATALEMLGFPVITCEARVRRGAMRLLPRTHMMLLVELEGRTWLCDVGFGGDGILLPVPLDGEERVQFLNRYRVVAEGSLCVLQVLRMGAWEDLYAFEPAERFAVDYEMANHYTSSHPESGFVKTLTAQICSPDVRRYLRNLTYSEARGDAVEGRELAPEEVAPLLREVFGIEVPAGGPHQLVNGLLI
ncbi:arylamine N-acetyltransferase [Geothrix sp. PMB-07]|uniref:arylamine N-acetyltransferase family protein n=1 Tax=Geothrix sp. PMB-07 TaxID=3068640 RepID=UPI0027412CB4|nr:arylamine N-acetyltransferase [Geothrix sp. PMB-07]WLT32610.1 arylamine N-acetyltransferase [Geothrix sp. PMB-07]